MSTIQYKSKKTNHDRTEGILTKVAIACGNVGFVVKRSTLEWMENQGSEEASKLLKSTEGYKPSEDDLWSKQYSGDPYYYPLSIHNYMTQDVNYFLGNRSDPYLVAAITHLGKEAGCKGSDLCIASFNLLEDEKYRVKYNNASGMAFDIDDEHVEIIDA